MLISQCHVDGPAEADGLPEAHGPPKVHGPRGHSPPCPPSRRPWMAIKTIICLSFIVLNNFFANMSVKKKLCLTNQKPYRTSLDLTGPRFEPQTSRSRDERVTARPTGRCFFVILQIYWYE